MVEAQPRNMVEAQPRNMVEATRSATGGNLRFLYLLKEGPANESFGIHVARIAGLPNPVIQRAWQVLEELEKNTGQSQADPAQLSLFDTPQPFEPAPALEAPAEPHPVLQELETTDVNTMTPIQALNFVAKLQEISRGSAATSGSRPSP
jgi:DNA mismatch repair protein MutS